MQPKVEKLVSQGIPSNLAEDIVNAGYSVTSLRSLTKAKLAKQFGKPDAELIYRAVRREEIPDEVMQRLIAESDWKCCFCYTGLEQPVIVHHIEEYAKTKDNSYDNLVVLCLNHHATAHTKCDIAQRPMPPDLIRERKRTWAAIVSDVKAGKRAWPANPADMRNTFWKSDIDALRDYGAFFNRKAFHREFAKEDNMADFGEALKNVLTMVRSGLRESKAGSMPATKSPHTLDNRVWADAMEVIGNRLEDLSDRFAAAVRDGELHIEESGQYRIYNPNLAVEIDNMRDAIIALLNKILVQADLPAVGGVKRSNVTKMFEEGKDISQQ